MARLSTCKGCGKKLQPEEKHIHSSKTYCEECFKKIERDSTEYKQLIEFICNNYELEKPTGFMLKQIKELRTEYGYSYAAMTYTLLKRREPSPNAPTSFKISASLFSSTYLSQNSSYLSSVSITIQENFFLSAGFFN
jgi:predicted RNA-binding Zn-ribbon protein involved in translation (DUF1610 family)